MDNLAHTLVGAALGRAVGDRHVPHAALIGAVAGNVPDLAEVFIGFPWPNRADYLVLHRGITHSLVVAFVEILVMGVLAGMLLRFVARRRGTPAPPWMPVFACVGIALLSHLVLDWQGSYGWRPFLPWNGRWYYGDWVAIVDPFFWLLPLIALAWGAQRHWAPLAGAVVVGGTMTYFVVRSASIVASWVLALYAVLCVVAVIGWLRYWVGPAGRQRAATYAVLAVGVYAAAQGVAVQLRRAEIRAEARHRLGGAAQWAALTRVGHPFTWEAVYAGPDTVAGDGWSMARHLDDPLVTRALRETHEGRAMALFARFLVAERDSVTVYLRDARYSRGGRNDWATLSVRLERRP